MEQENTTFIKQLEPLVDALLLNNVQFDTLTLTVPDYVALLKEVRSITGVLNTPVEHLHSINVLGKMLKISVPEPEVKFSYLSKVALQNNLQLNYRPVYRLFDGEQFVANAAFPDDISTTNITFKNED